LSSEIQDAFKREHEDSKGNKYTQDVHIGGAACFEIVRDSHGQIMDMSGSRGMRPWMR
jgi:hypothetical protein